MGFYIRKSISVGPLRFNLSKSGIGVSTGIKGFRVGSGPRGNYVQIGRGGLYFRQTFPSSRCSSPEVPDSQSSDVNFVEIESGSASQMVNSSSSALLEEINLKSKRLRIWPWVLGFSISLPFLLAALSSPTWVYCVLIPICSGGLIWAIYADQLRKSVVLFYDLEPHIEEAFQKLHDSFDALRTCSRVWHIQSRGDITTTYDWKVNAGADALVRRESIRPYAGLPPYFKCNIKIPVLPAGQTRLFFFPDRILVWEVGGVGAVGFEQLNINFDQQRFIEGNGVPSDARVVDTTWKFVNKNGGPDRRFSNNREIPIALYEAILFSSKSGVRELFQASRIGIGTQLNEAIKQMASAISLRGNSNSENGYLKCPCNHCDVFIEFPAEGVGQTISCPRCGMDTVLFKPTGEIASS